MFKAWIAPIELPRRWKVILGSTEVLGPIGLAAVPLLWNGKELPSYIANGVLAVAAVTVIAMVVLRVLSWIGEPAKRYVDILLKELAMEVWEKPVKSLVGPIWQHRVTLFELRRRWWICILFSPKWTHCLIPRTRWPLDGRRPRRVFRVHEHIVENGEGVCGQVFASGSVITTDLPDLHAPGVSYSSYAEYAKKTLDEVEKVKRERYYSRIIGGIAINGEDGRIWGVLTFDSPDLAALAPNGLDSAAAKRTLSVLTGVLSESHR